MRTRRLLGAAALTTIVATGLAGCVKMDMQLDLQSDDTVDGTIVFAVSSALVEMSGEDPETILQDLQGDDIVDEGSITSTEPYDDGEFIGQKMTFEGESLDSFAGTGAEEMSIVRDGDEFVVTGTMDLSEDVMGTGAEGEGGDMMAGFLEGFDIQIAITFPGKVSEHNGTLEGNTVTWQPEFGEVNEFNARGSAIEGGGLGLPLPLLIGIIAAVLLAVGLIVFFVLRSRRNAVAPAATGYAAPGYAPGAGYAPPGTGYAPAGTAYAPDAGQPTAPPADAAQPVQPTQPPQPVQPAQPPVAPPPPPGTTPPPPQG